MKGKHPYYIRKQKTFQMAHQLKEIDWQFFLVKNNTDKSLATSTQS